MPPRRAARPGSPFFSQRLLQDSLVEAEIGDELLELPVLVAEPAQFAELGHAQAAELLLPPVEGAFGDLQLPADLGDRGAAPRLAKGHDDLLLGESTTSHRVAPPDSLPEPWADPNLPALCEPHLS